MRDEFLNGELFGNLAEAEVLTDRWVRFYNNVRPHSSLKGIAPQTVIPEKKEAEPKCREGTGNVDRTQYT